MGTMIIRDAIAIVEPRRVRRIALCPLPIRRYWCPGRIPIAVSSSGAPRKTDGMKFRKV